MKSLATLPQVHIEIDGVALADSDARALAHVRVQQRLSQPTVCELTFCDPPGPLSAVGRLSPGSALRLTVNGQAEALFAGQITALEYVYEASHGREIVLRAYDLLHSLRKRQEVRVHVQVTPRDLARQLVADLGLNVEAVTPGPLWQRLIQHRQSDFELLVTVAERCGLYLTIRDSTLHLVTLEGLGDTLNCELGDDLFEARLEVNGDPSCRTITAAGWNPLRVETHSGRAASARDGRDVAAEVSPQSVGGSGRREIVGETTLDDGHADALAQAELDQRIAREVTFWGVAEGDSRLRPGTPVQVAGIHPSVSGRYVLTEVTHTVDRQRGFISELSTVPPQPAKRQPGTVAAPGIVSQINDPDNIGRVKVTLPTYNDVETDWMGVISVGAGAGKGLIATPDVGDAVLVLFINEDPGQGVILGGLYGMDGPPDSGVEGDTTRRYTFVTSGGQRIQLDDTKKTVRVENSASSFIELAPGIVRLHAATDLDIDAPGHSIRIRGKAIDFESA